MIVNIFGSTGNIGVKSLDIIKNFFPEYKINLLVANKNYKKLIIQANKYKPDFIYLKDQSNYILIKKKINKNIKLLNTDELILYLETSNSDMTILSISGFQSLFYFQYIIKNTKNLGLVSKECIVSSGHIFKKLLRNTRTVIFPLDSEHYSIFDYFKKNKSINNIKKIFLTASGGPFLSTDPKKFNSITSDQAVKHPKWKMGYKNSIDSATMANKCLEIVEARYLFDIPYERLDIVIHPQSLIHSIIEYDNMTSHMNYFYNDMFIPIFNFFTHGNNDVCMGKKQNKFNFKKEIDLNFSEVDIKKFPIYKTFLNFEKDNPKNIINFNCSNEYAVELFKSKMINYNDIDYIVNKCLDININYPVNNIENIIKYTEEYLVKINEIKK